MRLVACDIDGTLGAFCYPPGEGKDEDSLPGRTYCPQKLSRQVPYGQMRPAVQAAVQDPQTVLLFLTSRHESNWETTCQWLMDHFKVKEPLVICRPGNVPSKEKQGWKVRTLINQLRLADYDKLDIYDDDIFWPERLPEEFAKLVGEGTKVPETLLFHVEHGWLVEHFAIDAPR